DHNWERAGGEDRKDPGDKGWNRQRDHIAGELRLIGGGSERGHENQDGHQGGQDAAERAEHHPPLARGRNGRRVERIGRVAGRNHRHPSSAGWSPVAAGKEASSSAIRSSSTGPGTTSRTVPSRSSKKVTGRFATRY